MTKLTPKEKQGFEEIEHLIGLQGHSIALLKTRGIDLIDMTQSSFELNYNSNGEVILTYTIRGMDDREV